MNTAKGSVSGRIALVLSALLIFACTAIPSGASAPPTTSPAPSFSLTASAAATPAPSPASTPVAILPDEPWITFVWVHDAGNDGTNESGIYLVRPDGRDKHLLVPMAASHPDWSPDGNRLAFDTEPADGEQIWTVDADGTKVTGRHLRRRHPADLPPHRRGRPMAGTWRSTVRCRARPGRNTTGSRSRSSTWTPASRASSPRLPPPVPSTSSTSGRAGLRTGARSSSR